MKFITFLIISSFALLMSCSKQDECIEEDNKYTGACPQNIELVCGCNNKTYNNSCEAQRDGVISWADGECN